MSHSDAIVVTGATGFLGRAVCEDLLKRGLKFCALTRRSEWKMPGVQVQVVDSYLDQSIPVSRACIHLAESNDALASHLEIQNHRDVAMKVAENLLRRGYDRIVYASTALVYGTTKDYPRFESEEAMPMGPYAEAKRLVEKMFLAKGSTVVARLSNIFGIGMSHRHVISDILRQIRQPEIKIRDGKPVRDFLHVSDAARGLVDMALGNGFGIYNVGTGKGTSVEELAKIAYGISCQSKMTLVETQPGPLVTRLVLDPSKILRDFGWKPVTSLSNGLEGLLGEFAK